MQYDYLKGKFKRMRRTLYRIFKCYAQLLSIEIFFFTIYSLRNLSLTYKIVKL